ncbi:MAG: YraN family protein [Prevotella sp.]|nr:YraN family protein [Prevotella sp.]
MAVHNELGAWGEELASAFLQQKGYDVVERDWKFGHRDLDIIAKNDNMVAFVEVKTRRNRVFGEPEEAVDYRKLQNLRQAINYYVKSHRINCEIRVDVITVVGTPGGGPPEITHIEDIPMY